jgi:hypothetical protein
MQRLKVCRGRPPFYRDNSWLLFSPRSLFEDANVPSNGVVSPCWQQDYSVRRQPRPSRCSPFSVMEVGFRCQAWKHRSRPIREFPCGVIGYGPGDGLSGWCRNQPRGQPPPEAFPSAPCRLFRLLTRTSSFSLPPLRNPCPPQRRPNHASVAGGGSPPRLHPAANFWYFLNWQR